MTVPHFQKMPVLFFLFSNGSSSSVQHPVRATLWTVVASGDESSENAFFLPPTHEVPADDQHSILRLSAPWLHKK